MRKTKISAVLVAVCAIFVIIMIAGIVLYPTMEMETKEEVKEVDYALPLYAGEGVSVYWADGDGYIKGMFKGDEFTPTQTKAVALYAQFREGYSYCSQYSRFFNEDHAKVVEIVAEDGSRMFEYTFERGKSVSAESIKNIYIVAAADELPKLSVNIENSFSNVTRDEWVYAEFSLVCGSKYFGSGNFEGSGYIKGRGNTSWKMDKKPYSIKLKSEHSLLDIPATEKYAIISGFDDDSLLRNYLTYKTALDFNGISYVPKCEFVDVFLNGAYNGVYLLVERIDVEPTKVDISCADEFHITGGYLIEKNMSSKVSSDDEIWFKAPYRANPSDDVFSVIAPDPEDDDLKKEISEYLSAYMTDVHEAIMSTGDDDYLNYVDIESWADFLIIQELAKNIDGNLKTSCYMYKLENDNRLYMTAPWDFDLAYGVAGWSNGCLYNDMYDCPSGTGVTGLMVANSSCPWYDTLYHGYPEFYSAVIERYKEYRDSSIADMFPMIMEQAAYIYKSASQNDILWESDSVASTMELYEWLKGRVDWLDGEWLEEERTVPVRRVHIPSFAVAYCTLMNIYNMIALLSILYEEGYWSRCQKNSNKKPFVNIDDIIENGQDGLAT